MQEKLIFFDSFNNSWMRHTIKAIVSWAEYVTRKLQVAVALQAFCQAWIADLEGRELNSFLLDSLGYHQTKHFFPSENFVLKDEILLF